MVFEWEAATRLCGGGWDACGGLAGLLRGLPGGASYEDGMRQRPRGGCGTTRLTARQFPAAKSALGTMPAPRRIRRAVVVFAAASALSPGAKTPAAQSRSHFRRARGVEPGAAAAPFRPRRSVACRAANDDDAPQPAFGAERRRRRPALSNLASVQRTVDEKPPLDDDRPPTGAVLESLVAGERELYESTHERIGAGLKDLTNWAGFMFRANAMGLTEQVDLSKSVKDRIRHAVSVAKGEAPALVDKEETDVEDDWADIHADILVEEDEEDDLEPFERRELRDNDNLDLVKVDLVADDITEEEWADIQEAAFEVDTAVIDDKVMKGKWTIRNGKPSFKPWRFWPAQTPEERAAEAETMARVSAALRGEDPDEI